VATVRATDTGVELVRLVAFDDAPHGRYRNLLETPPPP